MHNIYPFRKVHKSVSEEPNTMKYACQNINSTQEAYIYGAVPICRILHKKLIFYFKNQISQNYTISPRSPVHIYLYRYFEQKSGQELLDLQYTSAFIILTSTVIFVVCANTVILETSSIGTSLYWNYSNLKRLIDAGLITVYPKNPDSFHLIQNGSRLLGQTVALILLTKSYLCYLFIDGAKRQNY